MPRIAPSLAITKLHHTVVPVHKVLAWLSLGAPLALEPCDDNDDHPQQPNQARNNAICDLLCGGIVGELEPECAVDDAKRDDGTAPPDVRVSCGIAAS